MAKHLLLGLSILSHEKNCQSQWETTLVKRQSIAKRTWKNWKAAEGNERTFKNIRKFDIKSFNLKLKKINSKFFQNMSFSFHVTNVLEEFSFR